MNNTLLGFGGDLSDIQYLSDTKIPFLKSIDFTLIGLNALHYLKNNPDISKEYHSRFSFSPMTCPPFNPLIPQAEGWDDPIAIGDTESRNDMAFNMMRLITGDRTYGKTEQEQVHARLLSYIKDSGKEDPKFPDLCWHTGHCACINDSRKWASLWSSGMLLQSECDRFRLDPSAAYDLSTAARLFGGIAHCAVRMDGRAYFHAGGAFFSDTEVADAYRGSYPLVMGPLCEYYDISKDPCCYILLTEIAEGFIHDLTPFHQHRADGGVEGHNHVQLHALRGMAQFAYLSKNVRYLEWVKAVYDYYRKWALDTGWLPEIRDSSDHSTHSETCLNADMHEIETWLALSGYDYLWDRIDRATRNYFLPCQFTLTSESESMFRIVNDARTPDEIENSIDFLKNLEGGFISAVTPNDRIFVLLEGTSHFGQVPYMGRNIVYDMMGCCPPEGMRAIYYTWKNIISETADGICIHLPYTSNSPLANITSCLPEKGKISVRAKKAGIYFIRVPQWTKRDKVQAFHNNKEIPVQWGSTSNEYVKFGPIFSCDEISVCYPLLDMWQEVEVTPYHLPVQKYRYHWIGNSVVEALPKGDYLPLYDNQIF